MLHFPWLCALYAYNSQQFWELNVRTAIFLNYSAHLTEGRNTRGPKRQERFFCRSGALHSTTTAHWSLHFTFLSSLYVTEAGVQLCWKDLIIDLLWSIYPEWIEPNLQKISVAQIPNGNWEDLSWEISS